MTPMARTHEAQPAERRRVGHGFAAGALAGMLALMVSAGAPADAASPKKGLAAPRSGSVSATYTMGLNGITIGRFRLDATVDQPNYAITIKGTTSGISRLVSDGTGLLKSSGRLAGGAILPASYYLDTTENGETSSIVDMRMRSGTIVSATALPPLPIREDRVPLLPQHKHHIVDPLSAMIAPLYPANMARACNRTIPVFDGWQRFDIRLFYKSTAEVKGENGSYSGTVYVCGARYVPVAGHRPSREAVKFMERNTNLEVWLAPAADVGVMLPYRMQIGTEAGVLTIHASRFAANGDDVKRAASN
ncbi:DUF3108 domain-containing protein [Kaistia geumhonensis]|uniref:DUF3108 domain-containing protein n=1 Tax=Kaistia geumhonensis TaxID=410839 RepID=A0ABU0M883_9HYPH|nr:DUF3108 domain-containing protein [Kaistia geumhonensis]MCX5477612.1 DUF3108 domain-containing protein [Kaistia geumhonensis]MDQ0517180.1 hypothetical protein [Kaistia geumhonensis]